MGGRVHLSGAGGIGIDENTVAIVDAVGEIEVAGDGRLWLVERRRDGSVSVTTRRSTAI